MHKKKSHGAQLVWNCTLYAGKCNFAGYSAHNLIGLISAFPWVFGSRVSILVDSIDMAYSRYFPLSILCMQASNIIGTINLDLKLIFQSCG